MIVHGKYATVHVGLNFVKLLSMYNNIVIHDVKMNTQLPELIWNNPKMLNATTLDSDIALGHCCHAKKGTYFDHIRQHSVFRSAKFSPTFNNQQVAANAGDR